ncbi:unnamed protein product [Mytilus coruscus]|uniref:HMCN n=1 Tax=Mytilus coruscus TaxID=42192 RepID=A0A6J8CHV6_MYTCO|nr:unnamed protein product [Mytilus coruscus]
MLSSLLSPIDNIPIGQHPYIIRLLKGVFNSRPPKVKLVPEWDLHKILDMLQKSPFEPLREAEIKFVTYKVIFLTAITTFRRCSDLQALRIGEGIVNVQSRDNKKLDPKRAIAIYLKRTEKVRKDEGKLFLSLVKPFKPVSSQTIARWIVNTIKMAYGEDDFKVNAHSTRAIGPSWALFNGASMKNGVDIDPISKQEPTEFSQLLIFCNAKSYPEVTNNDVIWTKQNNATFRSKGQQLVISNVKKVDSGFFVCSVVITLTPTLGQPVNVTGSTTVEVDVLYRPTVTVSPEHSEYYVLENVTNLQLACVVKEANPAVKSYRWYKNNAVISNVAVYTISSVHRSDSGNYTCDAINSVGTSITSSAIQLTILYGVELNPISTKTPIEGKQLLISCIGQSYPQITNRDVKWSKQSNNTFSRVGQQLVIDNVHKLDTGTYVCSVVVQLTPTVGQPVNVTGITIVEVDVLYRPNVTVSPDENPYQVIENTTNIQLTCMVIYANPAVTSYRWYKDGVKVSTAATYTILKVYRSHTGSYICDASNTVGSSDPSSVIQLDVLYGVSLKLSETEISINESERLELSCIGDGNPLPKITCVYRHNSTTVGKQKANVTTISEDHANCADTGLYTCSGNNTIGEPVSTSAVIKVACKPRTYNNWNKEDIFTSGTDESLNISATFISFPLSDISWSRVLSDGHLKDLDSEFISSTISSHLPYETISILQKNQLKPDEFGIYLVNASNLHGSFLLKYNVIQKREPIPPSFVYIVCKSTTAIVIWKPVLNRNVYQEYHIQYAETGQDMTSIKLYRNDTNQPMKYTITGLKPGRKYNFSILAVNLFGESRSNQMECLTEASLESFVQWTALNECRRKRGIWFKIPTDFCAVDGTFVEIYRSHIKPRELYFSGHRHYNSIHTQVIIVKYEKNSSYVEREFLDYQNDLHDDETDWTMPASQLNFPEECVLLGDRIIQIGIP